MSERLMKELIRKLERERDELKALYLDALESNDKLENENRKLIEQLETNNDLFGQALDAICEERDL